MNKDKASLQEPVIPSCKICLKKYSYGIVKEAYSPCPHLVYISPKSIGSKSSQVCPSLGPDLLQILKKNEIKI